MSDNNNIIMPSLGRDLSDSTELRHLLFAISKFFPMIIYVNLTKNSFKMLEYERYTTKKASVEGVFDDLITDGLTTIDPIHKKMFYDTFSRENLLKAYARGEQSVVLDVRQLGDDGIYRWVETNVVFLTNEENDDVIEISLSRPITKEKAREFENTRLRTILEMAVLAKYEYISLVDLKTGFYKLYANDGSNTHQVPESGDYETWAVFIRDTLVPEAEREEYYRQIKLTNFVARIKENGGMYSFRYRLNDTPEMRWREVACHFSLSDEDELLMTVRNVHDEVMAEQSKRTQEELLRAKERQQILTGLGFDIVVDVDLETKHAELLGDAVSFLQRDLICEDFPMGEINAGMVHPDDVDKVFKAMEVSQDTVTFGADFRFRRGSGAYFWCRAKAVILRDETGEPYRCLCKLTDIDEQKNSEQNLLQKAQRDLLTQLYNNKTTQILSNDYLSGEGAASRHALMLLDIDDFKQVNDNWGHLAGDEIIQSIAKALTSSFRSSDIIGRVGGDEFVVFLKNIDSTAEILDRAEVLRKQIMEIRLKEAGNDYVPLCSIGVSLYPDHGNTYSDLFQIADKALYYQKKHGKNGVMMYNGKQS